MCLSTPQQRDDIFTVFIVLLVMFCLQNRRQNRKPSDRSHQRQLNQESQFKHVCLCIKDQYDPPLIHIYCMYPLWYWYHGVVARGLNAWTTQQSVLISRTDEASWMKDEISAISNSKSSFFFFFFSEITTEDKDVSGFRVNVRVRSSTATTQLSNNSISCFLSN